MLSILRGRFGAKDAAEEFRFLQFCLLLTMALQRFHMFLFGQALESACLNRGEFLYKDIDRFRDESPFICEDSGCHLTIR